jgi:lipopolysaccharide/colanic/teichoic acid biosynthesis glycosyltransferase
LAVPALLAGAVVIRILSRRSPFIAHKRVGWNGSVLWIVKLRTMWNAGEPAPHRAAWIERIADEDGPGRKAPYDARIGHAFARFCRRHSLDEFPQLWQVVRGELALVGPRPVTRAEIRQHYGSAAGEILSVKPGVAGLWQISGRNRLTYRDRVRLDLEFVRHRTPAMYGRILLASMVEVLTGANTW